MASEIVNHVNQRSNNFLSGTSTNAGTARSEMHSKKKKISEKFNTVAVNDKIVDNFTVAPSNGVLSKSQKRRLRQKAKKEEKSKKLNDNTSFKRTLAQFDEVDAGGIAKKQCKHLILTNESDLHSVTEDKYEDDDDSVELTVENPLEVAVNLFKKILQPITLDLFLQ